jgi:uroporphyrinogen-III decarboxylase
LKITASSHGIGGRTLQRLNRSLKLYALGQRVWFVDGEGPRLAPITDGGELARLKDGLEHARLAPVYEAIAEVKGKLSPSVALLGFCGAPWTVATYMIAGRDPFSRSLSTST